MASVEEIYEIKLNVKCGPDCVICAVVEEDE